MKNLIYLVLIALVAAFLKDILGAVFKRLLEKLVQWIERVLGPTTFRVLKILADHVRNGIVGTALWLLGFLTVLYVLAFGVSLCLLGGVPTVDVPQHDIYVLHGQQGEARILVEDKSFRGLLFKNVFPPASLMQLKITSKQGDVTVLKDGSFQPIGGTTLKVHQGELVVVRYSFEEGYEIGYIQVAIYDRFDDVEKETEAEVKTIGFRKIPR